MHYSQLGIRTNKAAREFESINATLLQKGGFVHQVMAGVYTYLPLGLVVLNNIERIVREEMNTIGVEMLLPALAPQEVWEKTGRLESVDVNFEARGGNRLSRERNGATYVLNSSHEDLLTSIMSHLIESYKDFPVAVYQVQTKFRNEPRPKSGLLRGREFRMKDLYSFHTSEDDFQTYYEQVLQVYTRTFDRLGIGNDTVVALASGGDFSKEHSHEFQTRCETGEDTVYHDPETDTYYNEEVVSDTVRTQGVSFRASEVGNLYRLGTKYTAAFSWLHTAADGSKQPIYMGSYGLGTSRVLGVLVEKFHDERGIIWPTSVAPFQVYLAPLQLQDDEVATTTKRVYEQLQAAGVVVLFDDRTTVSPGEKLADADLLGIPWRLVISKKTGNQVEVKRRHEPEAIQMSLEAFLAQL